MFWGLKPDHILAQYADVVPKGNVLDLGAGEGRNALFFAKKGHVVESVDISKKALEKCIKWAKKTNLRIKTKVCDLTKIKIDKGKYSLIICAWVLNFFKKRDIETIIRKMKKGINLNNGRDNYSKIIKNFHKFGVGILGAFIIGNDLESPEYYKALTDFLIHSGIDMFQISILTPLPGTTLIGQLKREDRLIYNNFPEDWDKYRLSHVVHQPVDIDPKTIYIGDNYIKSHLYSFPAYQFRLLKSLLNLRHPANFITAYKLNQALKKSWHKSHYYSTYANTF